MRAAALLRRRVIFMLGLYRGGNRYHVVFEPLADFSQPGRASAPAAIEAAIARYAALLEQLLPQRSLQLVQLLRLLAQPGAAPARSALQPQLQRE